MIRSMSDEQMQTRCGWDKEPWACSLCGQRYAVLTDADNECQLIPSPRPECIPSPDPEPFENVENGERAATIPQEHRCSVCGHWCDVADGYGWICSRRGGCGSEWPEDYQFKPRPWGTFTPDPEFVRPDVNPILSAFRDSIDWPDPVTKLDAILFTLTKAPEETVWGHEWTHATDQQIFDAETILTRLRNVTEASK